MNKIPTQEELEQAAQYIKEAEKKTNSIMDKALTQVGGSMKLHEAVKALEEGKPVVFNVVHRFYTLEHFIDFLRVDSYLEHHIRTWSWRLMTEEEIAKDEGNERYKSSV